MKPSASEMKLCSVQEKPLDAVELTQAGVELEPHRVQGHRDVGEESVEAGSGEAVLQPAQANSGLESFSFRDFERGTIQGNSGVAVQPTQSGLGLESHSFQEEPNVEEEEVDIIEEILQAITRRMNNLRNHDCRMSNLRNDRHMNTSNILEQEEVDIIEEILQDILRKDWFMNGRCTNGLRNGRVWASHREEESGSNHNIMPQIPCSELNNLRDGQGETLDQEEEAGFNNSVVMRAPLLGRGNLRNDFWIGPPNQGTAWHRKRLQVPLCDAKLPSDPKCVSIASSERTCLCGGVSLGQESELLPTELADLLCEDANCSSASATVQEEGNTIGLIRAEGSIACVTELDRSDVAQQASQDVSGSSSNSPVCLFLGFFRDAYILVHLATGDYRAPCKGCSSGLAPCLFRIATLALIFICLMCSFCRLTRMVIISH